MPWSKQACLLSNMLSDLVLASNHLPDFAAIGSMKSSTAGGSFFSPFQKLTNAIMLCDLGRTV